MITLANEGLVVRGRGQATIVAPRRQFHRFAHRAAGLKAQMTSVGLTVTTEVRSLSPTKNSPHIGTPLPPQEWWQCERVRFIDGVPAAFIRTWLPASYAQTLTVESLTDASLHALLEESHGLRPVGGQRQIRAVPSDATLATLLGIYPGASLLLLEGTTLDQHGEVLEVFSTWHRGDLIALDLSFDQDHPEPADASPLALAKRLVSALELS
ncbi:MAG: GntR family transcriptional regulator [Propionibacteriaceae bacterium]|jgi:GntR family transcriptional regulator|nr:GntR family transcriptional regulator [Propionibacteriaceae bacterium]